MDRSRYLDHHKQSCDKMYTIAEAKSSDYAKAGDVFSNFKLVESLGIASTEKGLLVRMCDKMSRLSNILEADKVHVLDESIEDTLLDLANYSILLAGYLQEKKYENKKPDNHTRSISTVTFCGS